MPIDYDYRTYTLVVQVEHGSMQLELGSVTAKLPAQLAGRPGDLLDAFAEVLRAGADRLDNRRVLPSTFHSPGWTCPQ